MSNWILKHYLSSISLFTKYYLNDMLSFNSNIISISMTFGLNFKKQNTNRFKSILLILQWHSKMIRKKKKNCLWKITNLNSLDKQIYIYTDKKVCLEIHFSDVSDIFKHDKRKINPAKFNWESISEKC